MNTKTKIKISWVDSLKGLTILAVVLGHIQTPLTPYIFSWHIPLFFFLSGFFIKPILPLKDVIRKDIKKLMLPFYIFSIIALILELIKRKLLPNYIFATPNISIIEELKGIFFWMDYSHLHHYGFVLWFLPALFWAKLFVFSAVKWFKKPVIIIPLFLVIFYIFANDTITLPFCLDKALLASIWVLFGYYYFNYVHERISTRIKRFSILPLFLALIALPLPLINLSFKTVLPAWVGLIYSMLAILCITFIFSSFEKYTNIRFLNKWGVNTLFVLIIHPYINNLAYIVVGKFFNNLWYIEFIISVILISISLIIFEYGKKKIRNSGFINYFQ